MTETIYALPEPYDGIYENGKIISVFRPEQMQAAFDAGRASRDSEVEALRADALRYRWLRMRIEVKKMQPASGPSRAAIDVKVGCAFFDSGLPYTVPASYPIEQAEELDAAIDAARAAQEG